MTRHRSANRLKQRSAGLSGATSPDLEADMAGHGTAKTIDELPAQARAMLPHRPSPAEALHAQAGGALLVDIRVDDCEPGAPMTNVVDRLAAAVNAHDLDAVVGLIHQDYRSEQPAHPGRAFTGRAQMLANWEAMLAGIPDFCAEICRSVHDGDTTWTEWRWSGTRSDGQAFDVRGVTLFEISDDQIVAGRLYLEDVEQDVVSIEQAVEDLSGRRPRPAQP
jgi:limonene-1,2-epoxide hydrolase